MFLTLGQAAKKTGKQKTTILKAINSNRLSASKNKKGEWDIEPSELFRVYPKKEDNGLLSKKSERQDTPVNAFEIETLRERLKEKDELIKDLKEERDEWREEAKGVRLALTDQRERSPAPKTVKPISGVVDRFKIWLVGNGQKPETKPLKTQFSGK